MYSISMQPVNYILLTTEMYFFRFSLILKQIFNTLPNIIPQRIVTVIMDSAKKQVPIPIQARMLPAKTTALTPNLFAK